MPTSTEVSSPRSVCSQGSSSETRPPVPASQDTPPPSPSNASKIDPHTAPAPVSQDRAKTPPPDLEVPAIDKGPIEPRPPEDKDIEPRPPGDKDIEPRPPGDKDIEPRPPGDKDIEPGPPGDKDIEPRPLGDKDIESRPPGDKDIEPGPPGDKDIESRPPGDKDIEPRAPRDKDIEPRPLGDKDIESRPPGDKDIEPRPTGDKDIEPRPPRDNDIEPRPPGDKDIEPSQLKSTCGDADSDICQPPSKDEDVNPPSDDTTPLDGNTPYQAITTNKVADPTTSEDKAVDPTTSQDKVVDPTTSEDEVADPTISEDKAVDPTTSQDKVVDPATSEDKIVDPATSEDKVVDPATSVDKVVDPTTSEDKAVYSTSEDKIVDPTTSEDKIVDPTRSEDKLVDPTTSEDKVVDPTTSEDKVVDPTTSEDKIVDPTTSEDKLVDPTTSEDKVVDPTTSEYNTVCSTPVGPETTPHTMNWKTRCTAATPPPVLRSTSASPGRTMFIIIPNALLADLQSTTSHIATYQHQQQQHSPAPAFQHHGVAQTTRVTSDGPQQDVTDGIPGVCEPEILKTIKQSHSQTTTTSVNRTQYNVHPLPATATNGVHAALPPPASNKTMTPLSNNLSELDSLLQDLSSAQFIAEVDRRNAANEEPAYARAVPRDGRERTVDSLLYELESFTPPNKAEAPQPNHYEPQPNHYELVQPIQGTAAQRAPGAASTATRELDDLMASLSEFKMQKQGVEAPYATVNKPGRQPVAEEQVHAQQASTRQQAALGGPDQQNNNLDAMLGDLNTDMGRQGIMTVPKGHCAACAKPIIGQVITALGRIWHPEHFVCIQCKQELGTQNFFERDGQPYCERDYHMLFSPPCAHCGGPVLDKCITALEKTWHPEHFFCAQCGRLFGDDGFHEKDGKAYCRDDYFQMFAPRCGGCNQPIMDNFISGLGKQWHPECFVCYECHNPFGAASFYDHEGYPYCETHYHAKRGSLCAGCHKPITGRCITAMYKKFHPEHFVCAFCLKQLNKGTFKEENDKPYCHPCFAKLFG